MTSAILLPDDRTLLYCTETSNEVRRFDVVDGKQLDPLKAYPEGREGFVFFLSYMPDGRLMLSRGAHVEFLDPQTGETLHTMPQEGFGWAVISGAAWVFASASTSRSSMAWQSKEQSASDRRER